MDIQLKKLPHQIECLEAITSVFNGVHITSENPIFQNPIIDLNDTSIFENIDEIWTGEPLALKPIPQSMRRRLDSGILGIDAKLETGTGKTYIYTRLMYELHKQYGFNKFILLVPSTPIKEGTRSFIEADYSQRHFADLYSSATLKLEVLDPQKPHRSGRKMFPSSISRFARGTRLERNKINALLMTDSMLLSKKTMEKDDYDQAIFGSFTQPYEALAETRPIVIIDEPHRFKRENKAFQCIVKKLKPQCIIRFGATFPEDPQTKEKDYNNVVYNLGSCEAFNDSLVKGVAVQMLEAADADDGKIKLMNMTYRPRSCVFRNEATKRNFTLGIGDSLSIIDDRFGGISIEGIWQTANPDIARGVTLSNDQILQKGDIIYSSVYGATYQELMLKQAIENHFKQEKENFFRGSKIKTLTLFFIDSIYSFRGDKNDGALKLKFEDLLRSKLIEEIKMIEESNVDNSPRMREYQEYLEASLRDLKKTNGGYFSEDNSTKDEDIKNEVDKILRNKQSLVSFKSESGNWNTMRFIFSKWTLREGWDNPNVFQIAKLRSSGSEISKLQEVGRGLRLPVDEYGHRIDQEQFYLTYLVDHSEKSFAESLVSEINRDAEVVNNIRNLISKVAQGRNMDEAKLFAELLVADLVDVDMNIKPGKRDDLMENYPEFNTGVRQDKILDHGKGKSSKVGIRPERFHEIKELWGKINRKYYLELDEIPDKELQDAVLDILKSGVYDKTIVYTKEKKTEKGDEEVILRNKIVGHYVIEALIPYNEFLKRANKETGVPIVILHKAIVEFSEKQELPKDFFNGNTLQRFITSFQEWFETAFLKRFSYRKLGVESKETALTDINGNVKESLVQGSLGIMKDDSAAVPEKFLFDKMVYDSPKEKDSIAKSDIDEVVVFGKIPRRSIRVPLYYGGTTSPDFMYVLKKKDGQYVVNFIVETKDIAKKSGLRDDEMMRLESAKAFFEAMREDGFNVVFEKQMKNDDIVMMIKKLVD
jgi:type III restriction enzyme